MDPLVTMVVTIVCSMLASGGLWAFIQRRTERNDSKTKMILGLGHDRLVFLCLSYIKRGWITKEEYENLHKYLYLPYKALRGNGTVDKLMKHVDQLPIGESVYPMNSEEEIK